MSNFVLIVVVEFFVAEIKTNEKVKLEYVQPTLLSPIHAYSAQLESW